MPAAQTLPRLSAIAAIAQNRVIGYHNRVPWHLPADLKHFKTITWNKPIVMGRKTYQSIGHPLPNRSNIILTRSTTFAAQDCTIVHSLAAAIDYAKANKYEEMIIIGGAQLYAQCLPVITTLYLTIIHAHFPGDTYFPALAAQEWQVLSHTHYLPDERNQHHYSFLWLRKQQTDDG